MPIWLADALRHGADTFNSTTSTGMLTIDRIPIFVAVAIFLLCIFTITAWPRDLASIQELQQTYDDDRQMQDSTASVTKPMSPADRLKTQAVVPPSFNAQNDTFSTPKHIRIHPARPRPDQVILLTAADGGGHNGGIKNIMERALENRQEYCDYHGYICHWVNISRFDLHGKSPVWAKLPAVIETLETYPDAQWVWMLDLDAIIMSPRVDIAQKLLSHDSMKQQLLTNEKIKRTPWTTPTEIDPNDIDLLIAQDHGNINAGSFLVRRSKGTSLLLDMWKDSIIMDKGFPGAEQDAIVSSPHDSSGPSMLMLAPVLTSCPPTDTSRPHSCLRTQASWNRASANDTILGGER